MQESELLKAHNAVKSCFVPAALIVQAARNGDRTSPLLLVPAARNGGRTAPLRLVEGLIRALDAIDELEPGNEVWEHFHKAFPPQTRILDAWWPTGVPVPFKTRAGLSATSYHAFKLQFSVQVRSCLTCPGGAVTRILENGRRGQPEDWSIPLKNGSAIRITSTPFTYCDVNKERLTDCWSQICAALKQLDEPRMNESLERLESELEAAVGLAKEIKPPIPASFVRSSKTLNRTGTHIDKKFAVTVLTDAGISQSTAYRWLEEFARTVPSEDLEQLKAAARELAANGDDGA